VAVLSWAHYAMQGLLRLESDTRRYYRNGWMLLDQTKIAAMRMDQISKDEIEKLQFPGSASNGNNGLRTLRRMYSKAKEDKLIFEVPDFALFKEHGRSLRINDEAEKRLSAVTDQPLKDIIVAMGDTGMRNTRELYCMRVENVDFDAGTIFTPDSKTESGRRFIPMSSRVKQILEARCEGRSEGWVWEATPLWDWNSGRDGKLYANDFVLTPGLHLVDPKTGFETAIAALPFPLPSSVKLADPLP
jgi:integrase